MKRRGERSRSRGRRNAGRARGRGWSLPPHLGLEVRLGDVPDELPGADRPRPWLQTTARATRVQFAGGNALLVEDGRTVTVQWAHDPDEADADLSWLVQGWSVTLASLQRGNLSLHASTVQIGDEIVRSAGHQGAGKSTTAMGLRARGHRLLVDDTTVVEFRDGGAWTTPYARNVHLLRDTAEAVGVDADAFPLLARTARQVRLPRRGTTSRAASDRPHRGADTATGRKRSDLVSRSRCRPDPAASAARQSARSRSGDPGTARTSSGCSPNWPTPHQYS